MNNDKFMKTIDINMLGDTYEIIFNKTWTNRLEYPR